MTTASKATNHLVTVSLDAEYYKRLRKIVANRTDRRVPRTQDVSEWCESILRDAIWSAGLPNETEGE